jgi:hypothetical protein
VCSLPHSLRQYGTLPFVALRAIAPRRDGTQRK